MAQLSITRNGRLEGVFYLPDRPVVIGRADGVDIQLLDSRVSRRHSVIRQSVAGFMIQDLNTKNGTYVNKEAVEKSLLFHGDTVVIGGYTLHFLEEEGVEDLDSVQISALDSSRGLNLPPKLADSVSPKSRTQADPAGPPPAPANRLDRRRPRGEARPNPKKESITQVPIVEAGAEEESKLDIDIVIDDDSGPSPAPSGKKGTTHGLPRKALGELIEQVHEMDTPLVEEIDGDLRFEVKKGTTTLGSTEREDVRITAGGLVKGLLATLERDGHRVLLRPESVLRSVRVNGSRITEPSKLRPGDVFELAGRRFVYARNQLRAMENLDDLDGRLVS